MRALVLGAGRGTRLRPLTDHVPKPLAPVLGRPVIEHLLPRLPAPVAVNVHYRAERMRAVLGDVTFVDEPRLTGTAGPLASAASFLRDEPFVVASGDGFHDVDVAAMVERHRGAGAIATVGLMRIPSPERSALAELDDDGMLVRYVEKPRPEEVFTDLASIGLYVFEPEVLDLVPAGRAYDMARELIPSLIPRGVAGWVAAGYWNDIGTADDLLAANLHAARSRPVVVEPCDVAPTAELERCVVGPRAVVGEAAVVRDALVLPGARVPAGARVERAVSGDGEGVWEAWRAAAST